MLPFQRIEILLKASDDSGAWRSITEMESSLGKGSAVSKFALIHHADCIHWLSESFARSGSKGHTSVLYYIHQSKTNVSTEKKIVTRAHQYIVVQHCIRAALQVSGVFGYPAIHSADVRKLTFHCSYVRGWETACVCCGETVSPA